MFNFVCENIDNMKQVVRLIMIGVTLFVFGSCGDNRPVRQLPHLGDTPYQLDTILLAYAANPERALALLDSALLLGNVSEYRGQFIRAKIYCKSLAEQRLDSAILLCKELLAHDSVRNEPSEQENILDMLIATSRAKQDYESYVQWATQKAEICQKQGDETERWRTEADIGLVMTHLGQVDGGLKKLDESIGHLDSPGSINRMDAYIVACKRKINALNDLHRYNEVVPLGQRILDRLDHYEQHASDYAEDSYRLSWSDRPSDRDRYLDFSRAQALGFMAQGYAMQGEKGKAKEYLALFNKTGYGKTFAARRLIAPTQMALGMYDEALATYDEVERRMAGDTLNNDYAIILRSRAIAAYARATAASANAKHEAAAANSSLFTLHSSLNQAYGLMARYANLAQIVSDSLHKSEAHEYAVRYRLQEEQLKTQEANAALRLTYVVIGTCFLLFVIAVAISIYYYRQKRIISEKNRVLVRLINGMPPELPVDDQEPEPIEQEPVQSSMFNDIDAAIRNEQLYSRASLQRQDIIDRFGINRHTLNDLISAHTNGLSFPQYVNAIRIEEAKLLFDNQPDMTLTAIAEAVGFTPSNLREQFKRCYGMTPVEYRKQREMM